MSKYQKHITSNYGYKLLFVDDKFSKRFRSKLSEDAVYNFFNSMVSGSKQCSEMMEKHFNKKLELTKEDHEDFENSTKCWICDNAYVDGDVKVRSNCHITKKYRGSACRDCNINAKLKHKTPFVFHNLKNYDSHLIMQELGKPNFKINGIPNGLKIYKL